MACPVVGKVLDVLKGVAPFIGDYLNVDSAVVKELGDGLESYHLLFTVFNIHGAFNAEVEGLCSLLEPCHVVRHSLVVVVAECSADGAVYIDMEYGVIVLACAEGKHPVAEPADVLLQQFAVLAELGLNVVDECVGKHLSALDYHLIGIGIAVVAGLGEDGKGLIGDGAAVFVGNDFAHHAACSLGDCIEDSLGHAVADSGVKTLAVNGDGLNHFGKALEAVGFTADEHGLDVCFDNGDEILCEEQGIASACTAVLNGSAVAVCDLTILENELDGDGFACLTNGGEALGNGIADIGETIGFCAGLYRALVIKVEAGAAG